MKTVYGRILENSIFIYIGRIFHLFFNFFIHLFLANYFGEIAFGRLSIAIAYIGTFDTIADFGLNQIIVREISKHPDKEGDLLGTGIIFKFLLSWTAIVSLLLIMPFMGYNPETLILIAIISINFFISTKISSTRTVFESVFQARLRMGVPVLCFIIDDLLFAILILLFVRFFYLDLITTAILYVVCNLPGTIILVTRFFKLVKITLQPQWQTMRYLFRECLPVAGLLLFSILTTKIDVLMLSWMKGEAEVGLYSAATRLVYPLSFLSTPLTMSLFPLLAQYYATSKEQFGKFARLGTKYVLLIGLLISVPLAFAADKIIGTFYIASYAPSAPAFQWLTVALGFMYLNFYFIDIFINAGKQKMVTFIMAVSLVVNVALNIWLIPKLSFIGAAFAKLASTVLAFILLYFLLKYILNLSRLIEYVKMVSLALLFIAAQFLFKPLGLTWNLLAAFVIFMVLLIVLRVFHYEERKYFLTLFRLDRLFNR